MDTKNTGYFSKKERVKRSKKAPVPFLFFLFPKRIELGRGGL